MEIVDRKKTDKDNRKNNEPLTQVWRHLGIQVKWSAGFQISICLADKFFSENPHNAKSQTVISKAV